MSGVGTGCSFAAMPSVFIFHFHENKQPKKGKHMKRTIRHVTILIFLFLLLLEAQAGAHGVPLPVIVDTDMALDDMRAITMLVNSGSAEIPLIVTSDGVLSPQLGGNRMRGILAYFDKEEIPVLEGRALNKQAPPWRAWTEEIPFAGKKEEPGGGKPAGSAQKEIVETLKASHDPVLYLCLGPLTNLASALRLDPGIKDRISMLLYFGGPPEADDPGWNTLRDPAAAHNVFDSGINIYAINLGDRRLLPFGVEFFEEIEELKTPASRLFERLHSTPPVKRLLVQDHFRVWDEMIVVYMNEPGLFTFSPSAKRRNVMLLRAFEAEEVRESYVKLLGHPADFHLSARRSVVLKVFPRDPALFREDVRHYVDRIIEKHGYEEWKACVLTNEFHRHLGIYSLIGAKMGVRAREVLEAPFDALTVVSYAGKKPPLSCMNDGLQVSTGASLGRGTITISDRAPNPEAVFVSGQTRLLLKLKSDVWEGIGKQIKAAVEKFGGLNPAYFSHIRDLSVRYWHDLDRQQIFEEVIERVQTSR